MPRAYDPILAAAKQRAAQFPKGGGVELNPETDPQVFTGTKRGTQELDTFGPIPDTSDQNQFYPEDSSEADVGAMIIPASMRWEVDTDEPWKDFAPAQSDTDEPWKDFQRPTQVPHAFTDRILRGDALTRALGPIAGFAKGAKEHFDTQTPFGMSDETVQLWREHGIFADPATGRPGLIPREDEAAVKAIAVAGDAFLRTLHAGIGGVGGAVTATAEKFGVPRSEQLGREISGELERRMISGDAAVHMQPHARLEPNITPDKVHAQQIGTIPAAADFRTAAENLGGAETESNLRHLWETRGIHPAEAAHDAASDAFLKNELTTGSVHPSEKLPLEAWIEATNKGKPIEPIAAEAEVAEAQGVIEAQEKGEPLRAVGADVVTGPLPSLAEQPPLPRGRLVEAGRQAVAQLQGLGRNTQYLLDPMATGSDRAMVIAKDAINSVRRIRFEHAQADAELVRTFKDESLKRMWDAADEESVMRQEGKVSEHMGLATLTPAEREAVEREQAKSQDAWLGAVDVGMVEGEGLPSYTPRMALNVAAASEHVGPQALNELGRNVFTRVASMKHRKYFMAEETEAAAKQLVARRMAERGVAPEEIAAAVEKVQIARNIRALPLATAKLQEATVWHDMIRKIEEVGKASGTETVAEFNPGGGWFTVAGNPTFTKWGPIFERNPVTGAIVARTDDAGRPLMVPKPIYMAPEFKGPMRAILDESVNRGKLVQGASSLYGGLMAIKGRSMQAILNSPLIHNEVVWGKVAEAAGGRDWLGFGLYFRGNRIVNNPGRSSQLIERGLNPMGPRGAIQDITSIMESPDVLRGYQQSWTGKILGFLPGLYDEAAGVAVEKAIAKAGNFWHNTLLWDRVRDVQFGLADHLSDRLVAKGADRLTADRVATHFSNIVVGSIPKEAMSEAARASANMLLFSRSFTLGNLSTYKQAVLGLPKPILAQIERDFGISAEAALGEEAAAAVTKTASAMAKRKAVSTIALSAGMYYAGNALLQHAFNIMARDSTVDEELKGYARRYEAFMKDVSKDPFELRHLIGRLSPVYDNEPSKQDRVHIGYDKDGSAYYARNPVGKYGEEMVGYPDHPMKMIKQKLSPMAGGMLDVLENDKGFGRKIYDENDTSSLSGAKAAFAIGKYMVMKHLPESQIMAGVDLLRGEGDTTLNTLRLVAPIAGFTVSKGAPGGMARGEQLDAKQDFEARFNIAWPDIRKQIQAGDILSAREAMEAIRVPRNMQNGLIRNASNPAGALHGRTLRDFYQYATPEQIERFERRREPNVAPQSSGGGVMQFLGNAAKGAAKGVAGALPQTPPEPITGPTGGGRRG